MHTANIKIVLTAILITVSILIFPIFLSGRFHLSKERRKLFFIIKLFGFIKVVNGYAEFIQEGIIIHLTKKLAIIIPFEKVLDMGKKVKPLRDYHLLNFKFNLEIGSNNGAISPLAVTFVINYISNYVNWFFYHKKPYFNLDANTTVYEDKDVLELFINGIVVFNLLMVVISIIKILLEKLYYASKRYEQNKQNHRNNT